MLEVSILVSDHAKERMRERIGCKEAKLFKIAQKAWRSTEKLDMREVSNAQRYVAGKTDSFYRKFMGMIYVFRSTPSSALMLVTVMPPTTRLARQRSERKGRVENRPERLKDRKPVWNTES